MMLLHKTVPSPWIRPFTMEGALARQVLLFEPASGGSDGKELPAVQETQVQSLGWEDPLDKGMAAHSSILAWRIPWTEGPGRIQSMQSQRDGHN